MMQIQKGVILFAAVLAVSSASASVEFHPELEQLAPPTPTPSFNFWTNLRSFSWGLTLGIPGGTMHNKVERCWYDTDKFFNQIEIAQNNTENNPDRNMEGLITDIYEVFVKLVSSIGSCYYFIEHIRNKIYAARDLINDFLASEYSLNKGDFYNSGLRLGFAISRMIA